MDGYELHGHLSEQLFSAIVDYFANFSSSVGSVSEEIYSLQAVYFSYTSAATYWRLPRYQPSSDTEYRFRATSRLQAMMTWKWGRA